MSDLPQHYTFAATSPFFIVLQVLQFIIPEFFNYFYLHSSYLLDSCLHLYNARVVINRLDVVFSLAITWNCTQSCGLLW